MGTKMGVFFPMGYQFRRTRTHAQWRGGGRGHGSRALARPTHYYHQVPGTRQHTAAAAATSDSRANAQGRPCDDPTPKVEGWRTRTRALTRPPPPTERRPAGSRQRHTKETAWADNTRTYDVRNRQRQKKKQTEEKQKASKTKSAERGR